MNTLRIENLSKRYPNGVKALNNVSLTITNGVYGLLGPNGAGKSTLMRTIAALQEPSEGTIHFNGEDIINQPDQIRKQLGYLPQEFGVYPRISAQHLLNHIAVLKGVTNKKERNEQVETLLYQTGLYKHRKKAVHTFSGGMRQRFGIAQALLGRPLLIIVDEPTAGLDPEERNRFLNLLSEIAEQIVVILSTHIVEDVRELCTKVAILAEGKVLAEGNPTILTQSLTGKVWGKTIEKQYLDEYESNYSVISTKLISGNIQIQVIANEQPELSFEPLSPDLENVYFNTLYNSSN